MRIKDKLIEPYEIEVDSLQYTLVKKTGTQDKKGVDNYQTIGYFNNLPFALKRVAKEQLLNSGVKNIELSDFVKNIDSNFEEIQKSIIV